MIMVNSDNAFSTNVISNFISILPRDSWHKVTWVNVYWIC